MNINYNDAIWELCHLDMPILSILNKLETFLLKLVSKKSKQSLSKLNLFYNHCYI